MGKKQSNISRAYKELVEVGILVKEGREYTCTIEIKVIGKYLEVEEGDG